MLYHVFTTMNNKNNVNNKMIRYDCHYVFTARLR